MTKLRYLVPFLGLLSCNFTSFTNAEVDKSSCGLLGSWSDITMIIEPDGTVHNFTFSNNELTEEVFQAHATSIHNIYYSGQGFIEIAATPVLQFTNNRLYYKGSKLGKYKVSNNCSEIELTKKASIEEFAGSDSCQILYRYENIMALKQGEQVVIYMQRDPKNPYFVGEN